MLALLTMLAALLSLSLGIVQLTPMQVLRILGSGERDSLEARILFYSRLPRTLGCLLCGAALAMSGAVIQSVLRNPLAAPNVIGVNAGAGFAAALCCALFPYSPTVVPAAAFLGALGGVLLVLAIGEKTGASRLTLILSGIAVSAMFTGGIDLVITLAPDALTGYTDFRVGTFSSVTMARVQPAAAVILPAAVLVCLMARSAEILSLGDDTARSLGLRIRPVRILLLAAAAALTGAAVTIAGLIGFVGLLVPHTVRGVTKGELFPLFLCSALGGACFITICDLASRTLFLPYEIPVGIILSLLGGPFFLWLILGTGHDRLRKGGHRHAGM